VHGGAGTGRPGDRLQPGFPAEPRFLALGVLTGGGGDALLAGRAVDASVEQVPDLGDADGFGEGGGKVGTGDFVDGAVIEHAAGTERDAAVEVVALAVDDEAGKGAIDREGARFPAVAQLGALFPGEEADFERASDVA